MAGSGPVRGIFYDPGVERLFCISGGEFYEVGEGGAPTKLGDVATGVLPVTWASNGVGGQQIMFTSGGRGYIFNLASDTFHLIEAEHFPANVIAVARKASTPDVLRGLVVHDDVVRLIGSRTTETWYNSGDALRPFSPVQGSIIDAGMGPQTTQFIGGALMVLGSSKEGGTREAWALTEQDVPVITPAGVLSEEICRRRGCSPHLHSHSEVESRPFQPSGKSRMNRPSACTYLSVLLAFNYLYVLFPFVRSF